MAGISICEIDFDEWVNLAINDPKAFEELRRSKIAAYIEKIHASRQQRIRCLQWRIDQVREKNKDSALAACYTISEMMWETFEHLRNVLHSGEELLSNYPDDSGKLIDQIRNRPVPDNLIPFPAKSTMI